MQALTHCDTNIMSTCTAVGQFKGQFNGAMECYMCGFNLAPELTPDCHNTPSTVSITSGAMERYTWVQCAEKLTPCHNAHSKG